jgi:hypothetical protein
MALTLNQVIRARRSVLTQLGKALRTVDTAQEKSERRIKRLKSRKIKVPEMQDLDVLVTEAQAIDRALDNYIGKLAEAKVAFQM